MLSLSNDEVVHRYEALEDGTLVGYAEYNLLSDGILFTHTEVLPEHEGKGVGSFLAAAVLGEARRQGWHVIPACPFIAAYLRKHPEWLDLVKPEIRRAFHV